MNLKRYPGLLSLLAATAMVMLTAPSAAAGTWRLVPSTPENPNPKFSSGTATGTMVPSTSGAPRVNIINGHELAHAEVYTIPAIYSGIDLFSNATDSGGLTGAQASTNNCVVTFTFEWLPNNGDPIADPAPRL